MPVSWTSEEKALLEATRSTLSTRELVKLFKKIGHSRSEDAIIKMSKKLGIHFSSFGNPNASGLSLEEEDAIDEILLERSKLILGLEPELPESPSAKGQVTTQKKAALSSILTELQQLRKSTPRTSSLITSHPTDSGKISLVVCLSDWHMGQEIVDPESGETTYNMEIAEERIESIPGMIVNSMGIEAIANTDECVILLMGDMITGEGIFPHQEMSLQDHALEQTLRTTKAIWFMIKKLKGVFPYIRVITTRGNHGRTDHSPEANWDNVIYQELELMIDLEGDKSIAIKNRYGAFNSCEVKGWRGMIRHEAPSQAETAGGAIKYAGWSAIHDWDWFAFGHVHHWGLFTYASKPIYRNGSLVGMDDYSEGLAKGDAPVQICFGVSESNPCAFVIPLYF